jgi:PEP-CTERM motif
VKPGAIRGCRVPRIAVLIALVCGLGSAPTIATADPITITGGALTTAGIFGPTTFILTGENFAAAGVGQPGFAAPTLCFPCVAGDLVSLDGNFAGESTLGSGPAIVNGVAYSKVFYAGGLQFEAETVQFPAGSSTVTLMSPFVLSTDSFLEGFLIATLQDPPVFRVPVAGLGVATATYNEGLDGLFSPSRVTYAFQSSTAPVPEPTSLLLLATGVVGTGIWRHVKRRRFVSS